MSIRTDNTNNVRLDPIGWRLSTDPEVQPVVYYCWFMANLTREAIHHCTMHLAARPSYMALARFAILYERLSLIEDLIDYLK
jgi:hypothetical protein